MVISLSADCPQSGKDTLFSLYQIYDPFAMRIAFGDEVRNDLLYMFKNSWKMGMTNELFKAINDTAKDKDLECLKLANLVDCDFKRYMVNHFDPARPRSLRFYLQRYATDYIRVHKKNELAWINRVMPTIQHCILMGRTVFITDTRMPTEFNTLKETGAVMVKVKADWNNPEDNAYESLLKDYKFDLEVTNVKHEPHKMFNELITHLDKLEEVKRARK